VALQPNAGYGLLIHEVFEIILCLLFDIIYLVVYVQFSLLTSNLYFCIFCILHLIYFCILPHFQPPSQNTEALPPLTPTGSPPSQSICFVHLPYLCNTQFFHVWLFLGPHLTLKMEAVWSSKMSGTIPSDTVSQWRTLEPSVRSSNLQIIVYI
jgi:hypothetical protein